MIYTVYNGSVLPTDTAPNVQQINFPVPLQSFVLDYRHNADVVGGVVLQYWGSILTDTINGLEPPKVGFTTINSISQPDSTLINLNLGIPVIVLKFSAYSNSGKRLFLAVVSERDYS